jgi:hypothetical protein
MIREYNTVNPTKMLFLGPILILSSTKLRVGALPERFEGDFQSGTRVWDLELFKDRWMKDADATEFDVRARAQAQGGLDVLLDCGETGLFLGWWRRAVEDCCRAAREMGGICSGGH